MREISVVQTKEQTWTDLLHEATAVRTGAENRFPLCVTLTTPLQHVNPLVLVSLAGGSDHFYWVTPDRRTVISAAGTAAQFQTGGARRFAKIRKHLQSVRFVSNATALTLPYGQGPLLYGGFAFAANSGPSGPWSEFPEGLLAVPTFSIVQHDGESFLSQSAWLSGPEHDFDALAALLDQERFSMQRRLLDHQPATDDEHRKMPLRGQATLPAPDISFDPAEVRDWTDAVLQLTAESRSGRVIKTVLSRHVDIELPGPIAIDRLLAGLAEEHPQSFIFSLTRNGRTFVGATPERLLQVVGKNLRSEALAGSTRRGTTDEEDAFLAGQLLGSEKERREQNIVLEWIMERLEKWCASLDTPGTPSVRRFPKVQHLHTPIAGVLREHTHILELIEALHPTPAVGGYPLDAALSLIATYEKQSRGWYAGPVGWVNPAGSGEFAVGIRSALIERAQARLFAGCGIVDGSDPEQELAEARLKLGVIFDSLVRALS